MLRRALLVVGLALVGCAWGDPGHPLPMRDGTAQGGPTRTPSGGGTGSNLGGGGGGGGESNARSVSDDAGASHGCEQLGQCCAAMVADDEVACLAVLQEHDEPFCEESVSRFCWNVTICNAEGCTGLGLIP